MEDLNGPILKFFADLIFKEIGIVYNEMTFYQLESRLESVVAHFELDSMETLHHKVAKLRDQKITKYILDVATNNETSFFRDAKVFKTLIREVIKPLAAEGKSVRIWSAACSTGQEPYSLAMELLTLQKKQKDFDFSIVATDYSQRALDKAKSGIYTQLEVQRGLGSANLVKYFNQKPKVDDRPGTLWEVNDELKKHISFSHFNLLEAWSITGSFDIILCRNVLIYQSLEKRYEILKNMHRYLKDDSYLVLGCAESISNLSDCYESTQFEEARFFRKLATQTKRVSNL
ncbi:MAG: protein-glutamate O-methyltransferase CheR [Pseudobacteriovorax sp.]|nr:protein-glutamate O-methyltransferase CheR [Pseudobacteriovorax sp.]